LLFMRLRLAPCPAVAFMCASGVRRAGGWDPGGAIRPVVPRAGRAQPQAALRAEQPEYDVGTLVPGTHRAACAERRTVIR
jgi:hypothetical protein